MPDTKLGNRHVCSECGTKFYDLGKPKAICPKCGAAQEQPAAERGTPRRRKTPASTEVDDEVESGTVEDAAGDDEEVKDDDFEGDDLGEIDDDDIDDDD